MKLITSRISVILLMVVMVIPFVCSDGFPNVDIADMSSFIEYVESVLGLAAYSTVKDSDVGFYLTNDHFTKREMCRDGKDIDLLCGGPILVVIHGWCQNYCSPYNELITAEYMNKKGYNIINVNWEKNAKTLYSIAAANVPLIGEIVGKFLLSYNLSPDRIAMNGFSLGAHVAGFAGKQITATINKRVKKIVGCDPAGPEFYGACNERLCTNDAELVVTVQTDKGCFGIATGLGHLNVQFFGGTSVQPGCLRLPDIKQMVDPTPQDFLRNVFCSHIKSYEYYAQMVCNTTVTCTVCDKALEYNVGMCCDNEQYIFKAEDIDATMTGKCYAEINLNEDPDIS